MLVVFDVDGTLTLSTRIDAEAFADAFERTFKRPLPSTRWSEYAIPTDQGIAEEACERLGLDPLRIRDFKQCFVDELRTKLARTQLAAVPGARSVLRELLRRGHAVALATGAWRESARLKLASAAIDVRGVRLVGSDDEPRREANLGNVLASAGSPADAVFIGDASWDVVAASAVSLAFVGVDAEGTGELRARGVEPVLAGFEDMDAVLEALAAALRRKPGHSPETSGGR